MAYDLYFKPVPREDVHGYKIFTFGYESSVKVSGPQALIDRWLKTFFTPKGSDFTDPEYGTLLADIVGGNFSDEDDLKATVLMSIEDANAQVRAQDVRGGYPDNECLSSCSLKDLQFTAADAVEIWLVLSNVAQQSVVFRIPDLTVRA